MLWFATVPLVDRLIRDELAKHDDISEVVLDLSGVGRLDYTGGAAISRLRAELRASGVTFTTIKVNPAAHRAVSIHLE